MKQEIKDIAVELAVRTAPAGGIAWYSQISWTAFLTGVLVVLQIVYLVRKWWREETEWGLRIKRWAEGQFTKPGDLS
ncbi:MULTISPECIES: hypothetical protein [unclassified Variovorax]|uniref:hypothetical protein n=1 Tax=unclassified Variovorax TaxID=663243 RepID=UPI00076DCB9B|nr:MULTISPECIES: hypothetical protein [unclassified Variovorax]KWT94695.1 hypothetical protein APY03_2570 [Variovorax sp. WDL1]PNG53166.1 hypothetical protein CHC06_04511 [Variovorax sp. B2]PNG53738.1 hypothetical protein CHC07_03558 [Variovorax sp. B4]VTV11189.1 hypothetical protein WDL1CHR_02072 [Variovorax sp. WDL1]